MIVMSKESIQIVKEQDVILFRNRVKELATKIINRQFFFISLVFLFCLEMRLF